MVERDIYGQDKDVGNTIKNPALDIIKVAQLNQYTDELLKKYSLLKIAIATNNEELSKTVNLSSSEIKLLGEMGSEISYNEDLQRKLNEEYERQNEILQFKDSIIGGTLVKLGVELDTTGKISNLINNMINNSGSFKFISGLPVIGKEITAGTKGLESLISLFENGFTKSIGNIKGLMTSIFAGGIVGAVSLIIAGFMKIGEIINKFNIGNFGTILGQIMSQISVIFAKLELSIASILKTLSPFITAIMTGIRDFILPVVNLVAELMKGIAEGLSAAFGDAESSGSGFKSILSAIGGLISFITPGIKLLAEIIGFTLGGVIRMITPLLEILGNVLSVFSSKAESSVSNIRTANSNISNNNIIYQPTYNMTGGKYESVTQMYQSVNKTDSGNFRSLLNNG